MEALVSVIMPSFNSKKTITQSIESVKAQTYNNWELLITDDCSTDGTLDILHEYASRDPRIKIFSNENNQGAGVSRNNSIKHAKGRFIAFLDSDDMWSAEKLTKQIYFMLEFGFALTYTYYTKIDQNGNITGRIHPPLVVHYKELLKSNVIGCLTAIYDTQLLGKVYMPAIRKRQDMALWLNILSKTDFAHCLPEELSVYREGHASLSSNKFKILTSQWSFYTDYLNFNIVKSTWYFLFYVVRALKKHGI